MVRVREKACDRCHQQASVLYRVRIDDTGRWVFICDRCYPDVSQGNPYYTYGGTWKARKSCG